MRKTYELSEDQYQRLMNASKPVPCMSIDGVNNLFPSPQESANAAWTKVAQEHGVNFTTILPSSKGDRFFAAEPLSETATARLRRDLETNFS